MGSGLEEQIADLLADGQRTAGHRERVADTVSEVEVAVHRDQHPSKPLPVPEPFCELFRLDEPVVVTLQEVHTVRRTSEVDPEVYRLLQRLAALRQMRQRLERPLEPVAGLARDRPPMRPVACPAT